MKRLTLAICAVLAMGCAASVSADTVIEDIIARVNNQIVTRTEFLRQKEQAAEEAKHAGPDDPPPAKEQDVLRDLIDQQLLLEKGKEIGVNPDADVIKRLDDIRKQMGLASMDDLEKAMQQQGVVFEEYKQRLREQFITQQVIRDEVGGNLGNKITQQEISDYYNAHKKDFAQPEQVRLSEILIATNGDDPDKLAKADADAKAALEKIRGGAKFEDVARQVSSGPTAADGGDLGTFKRGALAKELEDQTFNMKVGDTSDPIRTRQGFVLLKVTRHIQEGVPTLKDLTPHIEELIYYQKLQPALRTYLTKLREEAYIDIKQGYTDSGASPNQTKPIFTDADANKTAKKQKKKKRFLVL